MNKIMEVERETGQKENETTHLSQNSASSLNWVEIRGSGLSKTKNGGELAFIRQHWKKKDRRGPLFLQTSSSPGMTERKLEG